MASRKTKTARDCCRDDITQRLAVNIVEAVQHFDRRGVNGVHRTVENGVISVLLCNRFCAIFIFPCDVSLDLSRCFAARGGICRCSALILVGLPATNLDDKLQRAVDKCPIKASTRCLEIDDRHSHLWRHPKTKARRGLQGVAVENPR